VWPQDYACLRHFIKTDNVFSLKKWRLNQVRDETKRKEYEEKNLVGEIIKILVCN